MSDVPTTRIYPGHLSMSSGTSPKVKNSGEAQGLSSISEPSKSVDDIGKWGDISKGGDILCIPREAILQRK